MKRIAAGLFMLVIFLYNGSALAAGARSSILIDADTGRVLYESNAHEALPMASTTKVMTALLALEKGNLTDKVTASKNAFGVPGTSIYLSQGETLTLEQMLYGLMLASGNDAAVAVAEHIGGTVEEFCRMMTARAEELGCENTVFLTPHGLPNAAHHTTAYDLALITREALKNPTFATIVSTQRATIPWEGHSYDRVLSNKNKLLSTYPGALGVKTGYTKAAGRCLVFAAQRDGLTVIGVVLNCPDWFTEAAALMDKGFANWQKVTLLSKDEAIRSIPIVSGVAESVTVRALTDVAAPVLMDSWPDLVIDLPEYISAGVKKGDIVGSVSLTDNGQVLCTVPVYAETDVPARSFRHELARILEQWLSSAVPE